MKNRILISWILFFVSAVASFSAERPNIVLILADDMGYSDLGCYGGEIKTPNLDSLAKNGIRYIQAYNTSKCWTTRISLLTGLYHQRSDRDFSNTALIGKILKPASIRTSGGSIIFQDFSEERSTFGIPETRQDRARMPRVGGRSTPGHLITNW